MSFAVFQIVIQHQRLNLPEATYALSNFRDQLFYPSAGWTSRCCSAAQKSDRAMPGGIFVNRWICLPSLISQVHLAFVRIISIAVQRDKNILPMSYQLSVLYNRDGYTIDQVLIRINIFNPFLSISRCLQPSIYFWLLK